REIALLPQRAVGLERDAPFAGMADLAGGLQRSAWRGGVKSFADLPRPFHVARGDLQIAPRQVDTDAVAVDAVERALERDVSATGLERYHKLDLVMHVLGQGRVGHTCLVWHDGVGRLGEEEGRIAHVLAHLADVLFVIATDAPNAAHRKHFARA